MSITVDHLRTNLLVVPLGIDTPRPEFSWKLVTVAADAVQTACAIQVSSSEHFHNELLWDSGQITLDTPFGVVYAGVPLSSRHRYFWRVRVWDGQGVAGEWSSPAWFETALLETGAWTAHWISSTPPVENASQQPDDAALYLRGLVELPAAVVRGRAYVSALGWYRFFVNGEDLTGNALVPRWTPLDHIIEYQTYDITRQLQAGTNIIALAIGDGRYRGHLGAMSRRAVYGDRLAGFAQLELELADGSSLTVTTNEDWLAGPGRIVASDPQTGERVDLRIPDADWLNPQPPARFTRARALPSPSGTLVAEEVARVQQIASLPTQRIWRSSSGKQLVDFGQNFAGVMRIRLSGPAGSTVRLTFSEVLTSEGELDTRYLSAGPIKSVPQRDEVILGEEETWYQPWFTIHGFRYAEVDGLQRTLVPDDVEGCALSSDLPLVGTFESSDARLDQLHHNVLWSLRSNFVDTPTDCPTRERSGWTGDIQIFAPTAALFVDAQAFLRRYLRNVALEQLPNGTVPPFIPSESSQVSGGLPRFSRMNATSVGWGDVTVLLPWTLYQAYGDQRVLERQYESMRRWVDHLERDARTKTGRGRWFARRIGTLERYIIGNGYHWGEWLRAGDSFLDTAFQILITRSVVATAYFAHSSRLLSEIAHVLGREPDARHYAELAEHVRSAWRKAFVRPDGRIGDDKQDDYLRALAFNLVTPEQRPATLARLIELIEAAGDHLGTGFLSTPMLLPVLAENGRQDVAFRLLLQTTNPSWLSQIERGATTIWETWDGYDKKGNARMSHNHYAFGSVARWLQEGIAGLAAAPGYRRLRINPRIGGGLTKAASTIETPFGLARSAWRLEAGVVTLEVSVPPGTSAEVHLGDGRVEQVGSGNHQFEWASQPEASTTRH